MAYANVYLPLLFLRPPITYGRDAVNMARSIVYELEELSYMALSSHFLQFHTLESYRTQLSAVKPVARPIKTR